MYLYNVVLAGTHAGNLPELLAVNRALPTCVQYWSIAYDWVLYTEFFQIFFGALPQTPLWGLQRPPAGWFVHPPPQNVDPLRPCFPHALSSIQGRRLFLCLAITVCFWIPLLCSRCWVLGHACVCVCVRVCVCVCVCVCMLMYLAGCAHCHQAQPAFESAAAKLAADDSNVLAVVDCVASQGEENSVLNWILSTVDKGGFFLAQ